MVARAPTARSPRSHETSPHGCTMQLPALEVTPETDTSGAATDRSKRSWLAASGPRSSTVAVTVNGRPAVAVAGAASARVASATTGTWATTVATATSLPGW